jgi:membrane protease YdiL (CAAX protease family)
MTDPRTATPATTDTGRPFGAHLALRWWVPIVLTLVVVVGVNVLQLLFLAAAAIVEVGVFGTDPDALTLTPLTYLATNLAIIAVAPITMLVLAKAGRVPWRSVLTVGRRFAWRRLGGYLAAFAALMVVANLALFGLEPTSSSAFAVTGTTVALVAIVILTTPLQAASEELVFRGALTAAYASWIRAARPAVAVGIVLSTLLFAIAHFSSDPWMIVHYLGLGGSTAVMALIARGLEPAIAFHVMNNVFAMGVGAFFTGGGGIPQDRTAGTAGPSILLFLGAEVLAVLAGWWFERRRTRTGV